MKALAALTSPLAFLAFLAFLALAALAAPAWAGPPFALPPYPGASPLPMDASLSANDVPLEAAVFVTADGIGKVFDFYRKQIRAQKRKPVEHWFDPGAGYIGWFDPASSTMRLINARVLEGATLLVFSAMDPAPLLTAAPKIPAGLPTAPGARDVVTTRAQEKTGQDRTITFRVPGATPGRVMSQLVESGAKLGWKPRAEELPPAPGLRVLRRGNEVCVLRAQPTPDSAPEAPATDVVLVVATSAPGPSSPQDSEEASR